MSIDNTSELLYVPYPGTPLKKGSTGNDVKLMQYYLVAIREYIYPSLNPLKVDGIFGSATQTTVMQYQAIKGLTVDGIIGQLTWNAISADYASIPDSATDVYPGTPLTYGSTGIAVVTMQTKLNEIAPTYTSINLQSVDGVFGSNMAQSTRLFQRQFGLTPDEIIGEKTWYRIVGVHKNVKSGTPDNVLTTYPGYLIQVGSTGDYVRYVQSYMDRISTHNSAGFPLAKVDGIFGNATKALVLAFQTYYGLKADGIVGSKTWALMFTEYNATF